MTKRSREKARELVRSFHYWSEDIQRNASLDRDDAEERIARALDDERAAVWEECWRDAAAFTEEAVLDVGCTALEALGPIRRFRDALARCFRARAAALREERTGCICDIPNGRPDCPSHNAAALRCERFQN